MNTFARCCTCHSTEPVDHLTLSALGCCCCISKGKKENKQKLEPYFQYTLSLEAHKYWMYAIRVGKAGSEKAEAGCKWNAMRY